MHLAERFYLICSRYSMNCKKECLWPSTYKAVCQSVKFEAHAVYYSLQRTYSTPFSFISPNFIGRSCVDQGFVKKSSEHTWLVFLALSCTIAGRIESVITKSAAVGEYQ